MSGFERALLEGKERNELSQIAESLGRKPPARAKKAAIIDLIFELAGVTDEGGSAGAAAPADEGATGDEAQDAPVAEGSADEADGHEQGHADGAGPAAAEGDADEGATGDEAQDAPVAEGSADDADGSADGHEQGHADGAGPAAAEGDADEGGEARAESPADGDDRGGRRDQGGQGRKGGQDPSTQGGQKGDGQGRPDGGQQQGQKGQQQGQKGQDGGQGRGDEGGDEPEEGNRRRRRRGRGRGDQPEAYEGEPIDVEGLLDLRDDGYGFLRLHGYLPSSDDVYVSVKQVRQFGLRRGDVVKGKSRPASRNEKNPALLQIDAVNGGAPDAARERARFGDLTPLFPDDRIRLETEGAAANPTTRIIDLLAPVGKGQRGLIVSPPKAGKTTIMKQIARAVELNHPEIELIVLLVDERPEEVTDMRRWLINGTVASSTFDRPSEEHIQVAELVLERAKRMVEGGKDVMIILDGITRLARAYNLAAPPSGRIMSGGIDAAALYPPKRFFGAARNAEEGGSLTILATALVETGSRMDEHIFEEFKGTGNMELKLDRRLADRRTFPAIDVDASSTRHEELLFEKRQVAQVTTLRKLLGAIADNAEKEGGNGTAAAVELLLDRMHTFKTNADFLAEIAKARAAS